MSGNREYKSDVFSMLMQDKERALQPVSYTHLPEGERLYAHVSAAMSQILAAEEELSDSTGLSHGSVSIGALSLIHISKRKVNLM